MAILHKSLVKEVASNKPNASTAFNLPDSAPAGYRSFDSAYATNDKCPYFATNGLAWESGIGTFTAGSPDTLARTTVLESSTGSAIDFSSGGDVTVEVQWIASLGAYASNTPYVVVQGDGSTQQTMTGNAWTKVSSALASVVDDVHGFWDAANKRFMPTFAGIYLCKFDCQVTGAGSGGQCQPSLWRGSTPGSSSEYVTAPNSAAGSLPQGAVIQAVPFNGSTDFLECYFYLSNSSNCLTVANASRIKFSAFYMGPNL